MFIYIVNMFAILLLLCCTASVTAMESGFTFLLAARQRECFFENLKVNMSLDLEYQVTNIYSDKRLLCLCSLRKQTFFRKNVCFLRLTTLQLLVFVLHVFCEV